MEITILRKGVSNSQVLRTTEVESLYTLKMKKK